MIVFTSKATWIKAVNSCQRRGMRLMTIDTEMKNSDLARKKLDYGLDSVWVAAIYAGDKCDWVWYDSSEAVVQAFWSDGEPNGEEDKICTEALTEGLPLNWQAIHCNETRAFICEEEIAKKDGEEDPYRELTISGLRQNFTRCHVSD